MTAAGTAESVQHLDEGREIADGLLLSFDVWLLWRLARSAK